MFAAQYSIFSKLLKQFEWRTLRPIWELFNLEIQQSWFFLEMSKKDKTRFFDTPGTPAHYAFTTTVYPDIWVILGDVNQSGRPVYQNVAHENLVE